MSQLRNSISTTPVVTRGLVGQYDMIYNAGIGYDSIRTLILVKQTPHLINSTSDYLYPRPPSANGSYISFRDWGNGDVLIYPTPQLDTNNLGAHYSLLGSAAVSYIYLEPRWYDGSTFIQLLQSYFINTITIQMTLTFEDLTNYKGIYGYHNSGIIAQYENGYVKFGYYPAGTIYSVDIPASYFGTNIINIAHTLTPKVGNTKHISRVFINGKQYGTDVEIDYKFTFGTQPLLFGTSYPATNRFMKGNIYNILLYKTALTANEVYQNYLIDKFRFNINVNAN